LRLKVYQTFGMSQRTCSLDTNEAPWSFREHGSFRSVQRYLELRCRVKTPTVHSCSWGNSSRLSTLGKRQRKWEML